MGFDVKAWLSSKLLGQAGPQKGVSGYAKSKRQTTRELDEADAPSFPRRGDSDDDYNPYNDRDLDTDDDVMLPEAEGGVIIGSFK